MLHHPRKLSAVRTAALPPFGAEMPKANLLTPKPADVARILIIEDEPLIGLLMEQMIREIGYRVSGIAHTMAMARQEFAKRNFDGVLLDISIRGRHRPEIADFLLDIGVPFAFVTGYDYLVEPRHQTVPVLEKPFTPGQLRALLEKLVGSGSPTGKIAQTS
jgi:DNA-binding response OmpR family regulator